MTTTLQPELTNATSGDSHPAADKPSEGDVPSRLPHWIACLLAVVVFPLICVGGMVTTADAGMAVPDWPGTYGYNMFLYPIETWLFGPFDLLVEHGHRLLGSLAGLIAIALVFAAHRFEPRRWVFGFSIALLLLVIAQGLLGGFRVLLDQRVVAKLHGCVGPAFFMATVGFCVVTSRWWWHQQVTRSTTRLKDGLIRWPIFMAALAYGQLVIGAYLRHIAVDSSPGQYQHLVIAHVSVAVLILLGTLWQWLVTRQRVFGGSGIRGSASALLVLVFAQIGLGIATWVVKFGWPVWFANMGFAARFVIVEKSFLQINLITAHVAVGSLILAFWVVHALRCNRRFAAWRRAKAADLQT